jgi:hypothetical protein
MLQRSIQKVYRAWKRIFKEGIEDAEALVSCNESISNC